MTLTSTNQVPLDLGALRERLSAIEHRTPSGGAIPTGWDELDAVLPGGGLHRNSVHEWIGLDPLKPASRRWSPPLAMLLHAARQSVMAAARTGTPLSICWIGSRVRPSLQSLKARGAANADLLGRSMFIDADDPASRLWATDLAARCASVLVIADGSKFDMAATRRLQLAAEAGGWMVLLARPPSEAGEISAAATRWRVCREVSPGDEPRFAIELLRSKGIRSNHAQDRMFTVQRDSRAGLVLVPATPGARPRAAKIAG